MDLAAYANTFYNGDITGFVEEQYGFYDAEWGYRCKIAGQKDQDCEPYIPRLRGVRFMRFERPVEHIRRGALRMVLNPAYSLYSCDRPHLRTRVTLVKHWNPNASLWRKLKYVLPSPKHGLLSIKSRFEMADMYLKACKTFNKYCGKDVIYIHTRCGWYHPQYKYDCRYNFVANKANEWIEQLQTPPMRDSARKLMRNGQLLKKKRYPKSIDCYLDCVLDPDDSTYMSLYVKAPDNETYDKIIKELKKSKENKDDKTN